MSVYIESKLQSNLSPCLPACKKNNHQISLLKQIKIWIARSRQRKQLAQLEDHLLADIGYSRSQVQKEISKPFWKQ